MTSDAIIEQWEPLVNKMAWKIPVVGMDVEDVCQELRIVIHKAHEKYDPNRGASFKTYLYRAMLNRLLKLRENVAKFATTATNSDENIEKAGKVYLEEEGITFPVPLGPSEALMADLILCGYKRREIEAFSEEPREIKKALHRLKHEYGKVPEGVRTLVLPPTKGCLKAYKKLLAGKVRISFCTWTSAGIHMHKKASKAGFIPEAENFQGLVWHGSCAYKER